MQSAQIASFQLFQIRGAHRHLRLNDQVHVRVSRVSAYKVLRQVFADNELSGRLGTHSMRKTFANVVHQKLGHDISKTKKALGHKNINSTDSYLSFLQEEIDEAILAV